MVYKDSFSVQNGLAGGQNLAQNGHAGAAAAAAVPLEINLLGLRTQRHYPTGLFWEIAAKVGNEVILGCDAHAPSQLLDTAAIDTALDMVDRLGLKLLETAQLRPIK